MRKGDKLNINGTILYYAGIDANMKYNGVPLVILATDLNNPNTYGRYKMQTIKKYMEV